MILGIIDLSQIEARLLAWQAGQTDLLEGFANGEDVYSVFATDLFGVPVRKARKIDHKRIAETLTIRRGFGKDAILGCIAEGAPVLTNNGWKPIEEVLISDKLWDGIGWIDHKGVVEKGKKKCIKVNGIWMTPEHEILQQEGWTTAAELNINNQQSDQNTENLLLQKLNTVPPMGSSPSNVVAPAVKYHLQQETIWSKENLHAVMSVLKRHPVKLDAIRQMFVNRINLGFLTEFVRSLADVRPNHMNAMVKEVLESGPIGSKIEWIFWNTWQHYQDGIIQNLKSIGLTITKDMNLVIYDSQPESRILETVDILYSGPYHRFQVGNLMCSNCGYGMGATKFHGRCIANPGLKPYFDSGAYDYAFIEKLIKAYRWKYKKIPEYWNQVEKCFKWVIKYPACEDAEAGVGLKFYNNNGMVIIELPSTRQLKYPGACITRSGKIKWAHGYLWGGSITENIIQAIARDIFAEGILRVEDKKLASIVLHSHDEIVTMLPSKNSQKHLDKVMKEFCVVPEWAAGLPLDVEGELSEHYKK